MSTELRRREGFGNAPTRDTGATFLEVLIAVVLLGLASVAILTATRVTVVGTRIERDHSRAQQWLQSAIGALESTGRLDCDIVTPPYATAEETVRKTYEAEIRSVVQNPPGWVDSQITVQQPVKFWNGKAYTSTCADDLGYKLQLIEMRVTNPDGDVIESVQVVKTSG